MFNQLKTILKFIRKDRILRYLIPLKLIQILLGEKGL